MREMVIPRRGPYSCQKSCHECWQSFCLGASTLSDRTEPRSKRLPCLHIGKSKVLNPFAVVPSRQRREDRVTDVVLQQALQGRGLTAR